jgi:hypothetical protein
VKLVRVKILRTGYVVGKKFLRTAAEFEAELVRRDVRAIRRKVPVVKTAPYELVAHGLAVLHRRGLMGRFVIIGSC